MKVFYHDDMDGKCAAHVVNMLEDDETPAEIFHPINYGMKFPFDSVEDREVIYILDYSIEPEEMSRLLVTTPNVVWIDHHKTAIEKYEGFEWEIISRGQKSICRISDIRGIRDISKAGCELTWRWFKRFAKDQTPPSYVALISDRDTWAWQFGDNTRQFFAGLEAYDTNPNAAIWSALYHDKSGEYHERLMFEGVAIQRYKERTQQEYLIQNGFWVEFEGHKCYAVNGRYSSEPFEAVVPDAEIWMPFRYMKDRYWMVSLYSNKIDVSEIAEQFEYEGKKGGGHKGAAGFECAYPPFLPIP